MGDESDDDEEGDEDEEYEDETVDPDPWWLRRSGQRLAETLRGRKMIGPGRAGVRR